jgi:hypothetical protein
MALSKIKIFIIAFFICGTSFATDSDLVGNWVATSGDLSWARLEITRNMRVTGYRNCTQPTGCTEKSEFLLTSYGRTKLFSGTHNIGSGHIVDQVNEFTATEVLEVREGQLFLKEYLIFTPKPGAANMLLQTTFTRERARR